MTISVELELLEEEPEDPEPLAELLLPLPDELDAEGPELPDELDPEDPVLDRPEPELPE